MANSFGLVCIVTNAVPGWVEKTIKCPVHTIHFYSFLFYGSRDLVRRWLPELRSYIGSAHSERPIKVIYAQEAYVEVDPKLGFADSQGEYMLWKKAAMNGVLAELESLYDGLRGGTRRITNVVSVGDTEAEMCAAELASVDYDGSRHLPRLGRQYQRFCGLADHTALEDGCASSGSEGWSLQEKKEASLVARYGGGGRST